MWWLLATSKNGLEEVRDLRLSSNPRWSDSENVSLSVDLEGTEGQFESDPVPIRENVDGSMRTSLRHENIIEYARMEIIRAEADQSASMDTTHMEPHLEPLTSHLNGM